MRKPTGHIRPHGSGYEVAVPLGRDPITKRYTYAYQQAETLEEAEEVRGRLLEELQAGRERRDKVTFSQLLDEVREVAHVDFTTRGMYLGYVERTIRPSLGEYEVGYLEQHPGASGPAVRRAGTLPAAVRRAPRPGRLPAGWARQAQGRRHTRPRLR